MNVYEVTCSRCGASIKIDPESKSGFCEYCGHQVVIEPDAPAAPDQLRYETVTVECKYNRDRIIEDYRKMGWFLKHIDGDILYFSRDLKMKNYDKLKDCYDRYVAVKKEIKYLQTHDKGAEKALLIAWIAVTAVSAVIIPLIMSTDSFISVGIKIAATVVLSPLIGLIGLAVVGMIQSLRNKSDPRIDKKYDELESIVSEAEKYL